MKQALIIVITLISISSKTNADTFTYSSNSSTVIIQTIKTGLISYKLQNKLGFATCSASGEATWGDPSKWLGSESDSDSDGHAYEVDEYISETEGWLAIRIKSDDKSTLSLVADEVFLKKHKDCDVNNIKFLYVK